MGKKANPLASRIKRVMQADEDVGKIAQLVPFLMERALELFLQQLCTRAADVAQQRGARTVTPSHLKHVVSSDELLDFLRDTVASAPDLQDGAEDAPKPKRQRAEKPREPKTPKAGAAAVEHAITEEAAAAEAGGSAAVHEAAHGAQDSGTAAAGSGGRGRGRGRGRGGGGRGGGRGAGRGDGETVSAAEAPAPAVAAAAAVAAAGAAAAAAAGTGGDAAGAHHPEGPLHLPSLAGHPLLGGGRTFGGRGFGGRGFGGRGAGAAATAAAGSTAQQQGPQPAAPAAPEPSPFALAGSQQAAEQQQPAAVLLAAAPDVPQHDAEWDDEYD
ncbi:dr1-associated corepressor [Raphidocelis subcapitata]|uniref:Dr1-associated corepressor n=1 Tax=Raphidocelis subcapitata TaxID=307507 RepID=A0A2V0NTP7_9CHLO|nr:dr1-associated corepressor [Raphidocelis subcapitata]|eukprot:GBF90689.1 dr1-associated corepressor [Raphidocelis subcapitata]